MPNVVEKNICDEVGQDGEFNRDYVRQVTTACYDMFYEMMQKTGAKGHDQITAEKLNVPKITKPMLSEWLSLLVGIVDNYMIPLMDNAVCYKEELERLKKEKIEEQKKIIDLQDKLIEKREVELKSVKESVDSVKETVESGLKSYSSVLQRSCTKALAPRKIAAAVKSATKEEDRSTNIVVFGVKEEENEELAPKIQGILEHLSERPNIVASRRIGRTKSDMPRPIRFKVKSSSTAFSILGKAKKLKEIDDCKSIYLAPDRTAEEQAARKKLVGELKVKRTSDPQKHYFIRRGQVTCVSSGD